MSLEAVVNTLLGRLEQVASRLEKIEKQISVGGASAAPAAAGGDTSASVAAFDALVEEHLTGYYKDSEEIGGVVAQQGASLILTFICHVERPKAAQSILDLLVHDFPCRNTQYLAS